jgi:hypothetical protein
MSPVVLVVVAWLSALLSRIVKHGTSYGLNYNLLQPDGALYHALTLRILGNSWTESNAMVNHYFHNRIGTTYLSGVFDRSTEFVILTRPLYSLLSAPFVLLFGQTGMFVIPAISFLVLGLVIYAVGVRIHKPYLAVFLYFSLTVSSSVNRWMVSDLTDGLLLAIISIIYLLILNNRTKMLFIFIVTLALLTRPSGPVLVALLTPFALAYRKFSFYFGIAMSVFGTLLLAVISPEAAGTQTSGTYTVYQRLQDFSIHGVKVVIVEFGQLFVMDRVLFVFIVLSTVTAITTWKNVYSRSYLSLFVVCFAMGAWNGALGVNFRYQLPLTIAGAFVLLINSGVIESRVNKLLQNQHRKKIIKE